MAQTQSNVLKSNFPYSFNLYSLSLLISWTCALSGSTALWAQQKVPDFLAIGLGRRLSRFNFGGSMQHAWDHPKPPPFADGPNDWEFWHVSGDGRFNIKMGHFEMPYGIEHTINSNGTLRQFSTNLGTKVDWGVTFNGTCFFMKLVWGVDRAWILNPR